MEYCDSVLSRIDKEVEGRELPPLYISYIKEIIKVANIVYKDNWEYGRIEKEDSEYILVIYLFFEKIEVTSESGTHHTIYNNLIEISINILNYPSLKVQLRRNKFTIEEFISGYTFSHAERGEVGKFKYLCFGSDTLISFSLSLIGKTAMSLSENKSFPEDYILEWQMYFNMLYNYFTWESISGIPYIRISQIGTDGFFSKDYINPLEIGTSFSLSEKIIDLILEQLHRVIVFEHIPDFIQEEYLHGHTRLKITSIFIKRLREEFLLNFDNLINEPGINFMFKINNGYRAPSIIASLTSFQIFTAAYQSENLLSKDESTSTFDLSNELIEIIEDITFRNKFYPKEIINTNRKKTKNELFRKISISSIGIAIIEKVINSFVFWSINRSR